MPTQNIIPVTPGSGLNLDAVSLTIGLNTVYRETLVIADPSNATYLATVTPGGALNVAEATLDGCITANVLAVSLPSAQITTLTPPSAAAIAAAIVANPPAVTVSGSVGVTQSTSPWVVAGGGTAGTAATGVVTVQGIAAMTPLLVTATFAAPQHVIVDSGTLTTVSTVTAVTSITNPVAVTGTFFQATQPVSIASGQVASGAFASGSIASGAIASGAIASGAIAAGAAAAGAFADGSVFVRSNAAATFPVTAIGTLTHNNAAPTTTNIGALVGVASAGAPTYTTGDQVLLSTDLSGNLRTTGTFTGAVTGTLTNNNAAPSTNNLGVLPALANAADPTWNEGDLVTASVTLAGYQRVILHAETTKGIGVVRTSDGAGNLLTSNSTTPAGHFALDSNITSILGTAPTTAGFIDIKGADGNVFVRQTTGTNLHVVTDSTSTTAVTQATASSLNATVVGTKTDNNAASDGNNIGALTAVANAVAPTRTEGDQVLLSVDINGGQRTIGGNIPEITAAWTSATAGNTALTQTVTGYSTVVVTFNQTSTLTGGLATFEVSDANTNWYTIAGVKTNAGGNSLTYTFLPTTNESFVFNVSGWVGFRVRLSTVISGSGTVNVGLQASSLPPNAENINVGIVNAAVKVVSDTASAALADNQANLNFFPSSAAVNDPLAVGDWVYGGAFSGSASATKQGWSKARTSTVFNTASVAATTTGNSAVWTPATGNKFRLLAFQITAQGLAATATGVVTVSFQDGASGITFGTYDVDVPAVAGVTSGVDQISGWVDIGKFGILSAAANNVLNFNISAAGAGTVGTYRVNVAGTEE